MAHNVSGASLNGILGRLNQTGRTHPYDAVTFSDWTIEAGDIVTVSQGDKSYTSPVHSSRTVWKGTPEVTLQSTGRKEREPISKVSKKKYGRGGAGIRNGERFYHDIYDPTGTVHSEISNTERGFEAKLSGVVDQYGNVTGASIATAINDAGQAGARINGAWVEINATYNLTLSDVITVTPGITVMKNVVVFGNEQGNTSSISGGQVRANSYQLHSGLNTYDLDYATLGTMVKTVSKSGNVLTLTRFDGTEETFSKATSLSGEWSGNIAAGKSYKVTATQEGSTIATHYSPSLDGMYTSGSRTWASDYLSFTQNIIVYDEDGEDLFKCEVQLYATEAYDQGVKFQTGKMVPFVASTSNAPYDSKKSSITSNGTYYACAEGYKSHSEGYDNATYSSDRYAEAVQFTVNVPNEPVIDTIWHSDHVPGGADVYENEEIARVYEIAREVHDNFCIRIKCGERKNTYYCET